MTCCLALTVAIAILRSLVRFVTATSEEDGAFAPIAFRHGPLADDLTDGPLPRPVRDPIGPRGSRLAVLLRVAVVTIALYVSSVFVLAVAGVAIVVAEPGAYLGRAIVLATLAAGLILAGARLEGGRSIASPSRETTALACAFAGSIWFELAIVDTEILGFVRLGACACCGWKGVVFVASGLVVSALALASLRASGTPRLAPKDLAP